MIKHICIVLASVLLLSNIVECQSKCGDYCYDCKKQTCLSCFFAVWDSTKKLCQPTTTQANVPQSVKLAAALSPNCAIRGKDNLCLQCKPQMISVFKIEAEEIKLDCEPIGSTAGKAIIGTTELTKTFKDNCLFIVPRKNNAEVTIQGVQVKLTGVKCKVCQLGIPNSNENDCISLPENNLKKIPFCSNHHYFSYRIGCMKCSDGYVLINGSCISNVKLTGSRLDNCEIALNTKNCQICGNNYHLKDDFTCGKDKDRDTFYN